MNVGDRVRLKICDYVGPAGATGRITRAVFEDRLVGVTFDSWFDITIRRGSQLNKNITIWVKISDLEPIAN